MTLIIILIGMAIEHFVGVADDMRRFAWFDQMVRWLENRLAEYPLWNGSFGVIITLLGPLVVVALISLLFTELFLPLGLIFALLILIYSLGPRYLNPQLDDLIDAMESDSDEATIEQLMNAFGYSAKLGNDFRILLENILVEANERLFGVLFWFIVLGPLGAILYRLSCLLWRQQSDIHGGYAESCRDLYNILNWPTVRLMALGNALTGNMVDAIEAWHEKESLSLTDNEDILCASGLGALAYTDEDSPENRVTWLESLQGLLNRNLLAWLSILGLMTLSGALA